MTRSGLSLESRQLLEYNSNVLAFVQHALTSHECSELNTRAQAGLAQILEKVQDDLRILCAA